MFDSLHTRITRLWTFMGFFQSPFLRVLHALLVLLLFMQLLGGLAVSPKLFGEPLPQALPLWGHMSMGLLILVLSVVLVVYSLRTRGFAHFYPYLFGNIAQLKQDIEASLRFRVVGPRPGGLASVVQGLGLGALLLTACSGALWFVFRMQHIKLGWVLEIHSMAALLLTLYFLGHGSMSLLHFHLWKTKMFAKTQRKE